MKLVWKHLLLLTYVLSTVVGSPAAVDREVAKNEVEQAGSNEDGGAGDTSDQVNKDVQEQKDNTEKKVEIPESLTLSTFYDVTSKQLTLVEFFSPYCSHCKQFAPTWEETYKEFYSNFKDLNVDMRQVNCVENGDLCSKEDIFAYPMLKVYVPERNDKGEVIPGKTKFVGSFPRSLMRTKENIKKFLKNAASEYNEGIIDVPSSSEELDNDKLMKLIAGENEVPYFVAFFPSTDEQWRNTELTGKDHFVKTCYDCQEYKQLWDKLSNQILTKAGHFNCFSNPALCEELGYTNIVTQRSFYKPRFAMFLPKSAEIIRLKYNGEISLPEMKKYANKLFDNYQYSKITVKGLMDEMMLVDKLPHKSLDLYYPLNNAISVIYYYEEDKLLDEDRAILPYLLEEITNSPFNIKLFTGRSKKFDEVIQSQGENIIDFINYEGNSDHKTYNKGLQLLTTITSKPTLFVFKDNSICPTLFQNFAIDDMRNNNKIKKFIKQNQYPLYNELTASLLSTYFDSNEDSITDKIVVTLIDSDNAALTNQALYNISLAAHEYFYLKNEYYYNEIISARENKNEKVEELKGNNADKVAIIQEMRKEVPHNFDLNNVQFTFIDIANDEDLKFAKAWKINHKNYRVGDSFIISKDNRYYWDNISGVQIKNEPTIIKTVLLSLLDPVKFGGHLSKKLVGSPYPRYLSYMDYIHDRGFFGYFFFFIFLYFAKKAFNFGMKKRRTSTRYESTGIIGNIPKKD